MWPKERKGALKSDPGEQGDLEWERADLKQWKKRSSSKAVLSNSFSGLGYTSVGRTKSGNQDTWVPASTVPLQYFPAGSWAPYSHVMKHFVCVCHLLSGDKNCHPITSCWYWERIDVEQRCEIKWSSTNGSLFLPLLLIFMSSVLSPVIIEDRDLCYHLISLFSELLVSLFSETFPSQFRCPPGLKFLSTRDNQMASENTNVGFVSQCAWLPHGDVHKVLLPAKPSRPLKTSPSSCFVTFPVSVLTPPLPASWQCDFPPFFLSIPLQSDNTCWYQHY